MIKEMECVCSCVKVGSPEMLANLCMLQIPDCVYSVVDTSASDWSLYVRYEQQIAV